MRHVPTLLRRELSAYFLSPMAYLILLAFQVIAALNFFQMVELLSQPRLVIAGVRDPMNSYIAESLGFWVALLVAVPALTMRLIAEERRSGTLEGLLTAPVTEAEVIVAKWAAGVAMYLALLVPFALYLPFLRHFGRYAFDLGPLEALGIGLTTLGMMFVAVGVLFSTLARHQVVAAIGTFVVLLALLLIPRMGYFIASELRSSWADPLRFSSVYDQLLEFGAGRLDPRHLAMHLSLTACTLFAAVKVLESRRGH
jgi:ABC-2 type transport system permease protein